MSAVLAQEKSLFISLMMVVRLSDPELFPIDFTFDEATLVSPGPSISPSVSIVNHCCILT